MSRILRWLGVVERPTLRPSYAHRIHRVIDLTSGEVVIQRVQVTERDKRGRIRTVRILASA
jgi:hypothetical protein